MVSYKLIKLLLFLLVLAVPVVITTLLGHGIAVGTPTMTPGLYCERVPIVLEKVESGVR